MKGLEEFLKLFGEVTVLQIVEYVLAIVFIVCVYRKGKKFIDEKNKEELERKEIEKQRDADLKEALTSVRKYPEYRQQSIEIQRLLESEIQELRLGLADTKAQLIAMEETTKRREVSKLRDRLLQNYRYYISKEHNPSRSWTRMEAEAFWSLFKEYEEAGGNGYMHSVVLPAMQLLEVIEHNEHEENL